MVQRRVDPKKAKALREWFLHFMTVKEVIKRSHRDHIYVLESGVRLTPGDDHHDPSYEGFLIGPTQLCRAAGVNPATGGRWFNPESSDYNENYAPLAEYLRPLALALHKMLTELEHPEADQVTVVRAFLKAGYLEYQDLLDFAEIEGLEGWMREEDCLGNKLEELSEEGRLAVQEMYEFQLQKRGR
jgi:hypothetical protein